jgi:hypothetical protein
MNEMFMDQSGDGRRKNRRLGLFLAMLALLYIAAVIVFIIVY